MYVCLSHEMKLSNNRFAKYGEVVPEIDSWHPTAIRTHLNLGRIKKVDDVKETPKDNFEEILGEVSTTPVDRGTRRRKGK